MLKFPEDHLKWRPLNHECGCKNPKLDGVWMFSCLWRGRRCLIEVVVSLCMTGRRPLDMHPIAGGGRREGSRIITWAANFE